MSRKINLQVSRREKSISNKFREQNQHATSSKTKNHHAKGSINKLSFTRRKKKQHADFTKRNINMQEVSHKKSAHNKFHEK